jgi:serine/threonine protein kinase
MQANRWKKIQELYEAAVALPPAKRSEFLQQACPSDTGLRGEVQSLLAQQADSFLESAPLSAIRTLTPGAKLGNFEIVGPIGRGGMGEVYRARDARLKRDVAIKVLPAGLARDPDRIARFEREARAVAAVNHPNVVAVFDVGAEDGIFYIVSELVDGEPLRGARLELGKTLDIAVQIAAGLAAAHEAGIVHRDLKPDNILLTRDGRVKILDFGLAKVRPSRIDAAAATETNTASTEAGMVMGTVGYMSPEQVRGLPVNYGTDLFSFGVVLYEMIAGQRPFTGSSAMAVCDAILHAQPRDFGDSAVPGRLRAIIGNLLEKDPAKRYGSANEVHQDLKALAASLAPVPLVRLSREVWIAVGAAVVLAGLLAGWLWHRSSRQRWALETAAPEINRLIDVEEYVKAAKLTREAQLVLPKDPSLRKLWMRATGEVSIASEPSGADVSIRPYRGDPNAWESLGKTPLVKVRVPLDDYLWRVVKPGFAASFFIGDPPVVFPPGIYSRLDLTLKLRPAGGVPPEMVVVPGGWVGLGYPLASAPPAKVDDFLIDRHEVTNEEYKKFVEAGGYQNREFWKQPFARDGRAIPWDQAIALFHDATGRPGPAGWEVGDYPKGQEKYPVSGVSWYEAAAYAEFAGKRLPTAYHWTRASQLSSYTPVIAPGGNFHGVGTQPVGNPRALSGSGTTDMAGNVKEWCWNEARGMTRLILGGGFGEPDYMFDHTDVQSPWDRRANFGFRCMKLDAPPSAAAVARVEPKAYRNYWNEKPVPDEVFRAYTALYAYDKGELNAQVQETASVEGWARTKVTFDAAYGRERLAAYLYLPKNTPPPYQTVVYFPGAGAFFEDKLNFENLEETRGFLLKSGRAFIFPIYKGMYERRDGKAPWNMPPASLRDYTVMWAKDLGRSLDYLETRKDIDSTKVAYFGDSLGAALGGQLPAIEKRIKAAILSSGGFQLTLEYLPEGDPFNFVKHVTIPVLMLNGRYDHTFPLESSQFPLFHFLGTPSNDKKHVIYDDGHGAFPRPDAVRECLDWLDRYLGPVRH